MNLLRSPGVLTCATLTEMFVDQFSKLSNEDRAVVVDELCQKINVVLAGNFNLGYIPGQNRKSNEEK